MSFYNRKNFQYFVPFIIFLVGGSLGLREFTKLRYEYRTVSPIKSREEAKKMGIEMEDPTKITLEEEYKKIKSINLNSWENVRIPRPWDEEVENGND